MQAVPTLLTVDKAQFIREMELFQRYFQRIQLDIADGVLVSNRTTSISEMLDLLSENAAIFSARTTFDFHLMVKDYLPQLELIKTMKGQGVNIGVVLINARHMPDIAKLQRSYGFAIGLDIFPDVTIDDIELQYDLKTLKAIQIMTVRPGFQGSPFLPEMLLKIDQLRANGYTGEILIDGGVNADSLPIIGSSPHPPDVICIGSYLTKAGNDLEHRVRELAQV